MYWGACTKRKIKHAIGSEFAVNKREIESWAFRSGRKRPLATSLLECYLPAHPHAVALIEKNSTGASVLAGAHSMLKDSRSSKLHSLHAAERSAQHVHAARHATYAMFLADALGFGIWGGHIPVFKQKFQLSDASLSVVLLAVAVGAILSMPLAGQAVRHFGSRFCIAVSVACFGLCLVSIALAQSLIPFVVAALLFGAAKGAVDVGINAQAVSLRNVMGDRSCLPFRHSGASAVSPAAF
jgi:Major Facilitator Superfamily